MNKIIISALLLLATIQIGCKSYSKYPIDAQPRVKVDTNLIGIWKMDEDTDIHNYFVIERFNDFEYAVTYMDRGGSNRHYENWSVYFSKIGDYRFLNVGYRNYDHQTYETTEEGFFFLKVVSVDPDGWHMTLALVSDTTLKNITNPKEIRTRIEKNLNNAAFYDKPLHFVKILPLMYCK